MHKLTILFLFFLLIPLVSSLDETQVPIYADANTQFDIKIPCSLNGYYCNPTTLCNLSIPYQNSTFLINNKQMQVSGQYINYTLTPSETQIRGRYLGDIKCTDPFVGLNASSQFILNIGKEYTIQDSITNLFLVIFVMGLFIFCIWGAIKVPVNYSSNEYGETVHIPILMRQIRLLLIVISYMIFVWFTFVLYALTLSYVDLPAVSDFMWLLHRYSAAAIIPVSVIYIILCMIYWIKDMADLKKIRKGIGI